MAMVLSPTQEHFLKKQLIQLQLQQEFGKLNHPYALRSFGSPFNSYDYNSTNKEQEFPLLSFFFKQFVVSFPLLAHNDNQDAFWSKTVQSFVESLNSKAISSTSDRQQTSKRKQMSNKAIKSLVLCFNSTIVTGKDLVYLNSDHLKSGADLDKIAPTSANSSAVAEKTEYQNSLNLNIISVRYVTSPKQTSSFNFFSSSTESYYEFIIQVKQLGKNDNASPNFVARRYNEFQKLNQELKKAFPGVTLPPFPAKTKTASNVSQLAGNESEESNMSDENTGSNLNLLYSEVSTTPSTKDRLKPKRLVHKLKRSHSPEGQTNNINTFDLPREKMRLLLRGYLNGLVALSEVATSEQFLDFLTDKSFTELTDWERKDTSIRKHNDQAMKLNEAYFQEEAQSSVLQLRMDLEDFKKTIISTDDALRNIFYEIGERTEISQLSPLLQNFIHWAKIQLAATLYSLFLGHDNSAESYRQLKKLHGIFPYTMLYQVLKYTNPMFMMQKVLDLLLANVPFTNSCLLQYFFSMILNDEVKNVEKELFQLKKKIDFFGLCEKIDAYVATLDEELIERIKNESMVSGQDLLLSILKSDELKPPIAKSSIQKVTQSYESYSFLKDKHQERADLVKIASSELYSNLRNYWLLSLRKKDKDIMKQLCSEPELVDLLRQIITTVYHPLLKIFKASKIHLAFKNFEYFMNDLMKMLDYLDTHIYVLSPAQITNMIIEVLDQHQHSLFDFIHNLYVNDENNLFLDLIQWLEKFLNLLRIKLVSPDKVTIDLVKVVESSPIDEEEFMTELGNLIEKILIKRKIYDNIIKKNAKLRDENINPNKDWDTINNQMTNTFTGEDFGVDSHDMNDFNINFQDLEDFSSNEIQNYVRELNNIDNQLCNTKEISKLLPAFGHEISRVLAGVYSVGVQT